MRSQKQIQSPDSERAAQSGHFDLFLEQVEQRNQKLKILTCIPNFQVSDIYIYIYIYLSGKIANVRNVEFVSQVSKNIYRCNFLLRRVYLVKVQSKKLLFVSRVRIRCLKLTYIPLASFVLFLRKFLFSKKNIKIHKSFFSFFIKLQNTIQTPDSANSDRELSKNTQFCYVYSFLSRDTDLLRSL